ncbi:hypothetical protein D3C80_1483980 [compost metagenome]
MIVEGQLVQPFLILLALCNFPGDQHKLGRENLAPADWRYLRLQPYPVPFRGTHAQLGDAGAALYSALQLGPGYLRLADIIGER